MNYNKKAPAIADAFFGSPCPARTGDNSVNSRVLYHCKDFISNSSCRYFFLLVCFAFCVDYKIRNNIIITISTADNTEI